MPTLIGSLAGLLAVLLAGCSMARGVNELLPGAQYSKPVDITSSQIQVFKNGVFPKMPCIYVARIAAHGNGYATTETLEQTLREQAAKLKSDVVLIDKLEISNDETVGTYGTGIMLADTIKRPHLYGTACRLTRISLGVTNKDGIVQYVSANSLAARAGISEGDKLLAVNGQALYGDPFLIEREILSKSSGERVILEFLTKDNIKVTREIILEETKP
jgi:predicted metalloprotease with PDZ domain